MDENKEEKDEIEREKREREERGENTRKNVIRKREAWTKEGRREGE